MNNSDKTNRNIFCTIYFFYHSLSNLIYLIRFKLKYLRLKESEYAC